MKLAKFVKCRLSDEELARLENLAAFNRRGLSNQLRCIILDAVSQHEEDLRYAHELANAIENLAPKVEAKA